jgi:HSP20 family protein
MSDEVKVVKVADSGTPAEQPASPPTFAPAVDVIETPDALVVLADVPGVTKHKADVLFEQGVLTIRGEVEKVGEPGMRLELEEYQTGNFHRSFTVGGGLDVSHVEATVKDGVLRLVIPKSAALKPRLIQIKEG